METIKHEIFHQNEALLKTRAELLANRETLTGILAQPCTNLIFMGCGSSYMLSCGAADLFTMNTGLKAIALAGGEVLLNPEKYVKLFEGALVVVTSRSGETSEVVFALEKMKPLCSFRSLGIFAKVGCTLQSMVDFSVLIPWAYDESICQTRNISNFYYALSTLYAFHAGDSELEAAFDAFLAAQNAHLDAITPMCAEIAQRSWTNVTVLADGEVSGIASEGALAFTEISLLPGEHFHILDYRHGPIVVADSSKVVIVLLIPGEENQQKKMVADLVAHGACVITLGARDSAFWGSDYHVNLDGIRRYEVTGLPFINLCQVLAFSKAVANGHDPDDPNGLNAYIKLTK